VKPAFQKQRTGDMTEAKTGHKAPFFICTSP
jgi:hypothetical protein